jgi:hypothetical protein
LLIILAAAGIFLWCKLSLPRFQSIDLSVNQTKAIGIAKDFLRTQRGVDPKPYMMAVSFNVDEDTDRYLQKTVGNAGEQHLIRKLHYDLFFWTVRFFHEKQKEEYKVAISSASGEVIGFGHIIEDTAARPLVDKEKSRQVALDFLQKAFGFTTTQYLNHGEEVKKFDNRLEYTFSWQNKDVDIPWDKAKEKGHAKLLTNAVVTGNEIRAFQKYQFDIPDGFNRYVDNLKQTGQNLTLVFRLLYLALLTLAIVAVVNRKHQVVARAVRPFYIWIGVIIFVLMGVDVLNSYQNLLFDYPTTQSLGDYIVRQFIENIIGPFFIAVAFVLPALSGESLRFETAPREKHRAFLSTLLSSFRCAAVARQIFTGYLVAAVVLGVQAFIYQIGFKYCGVWDELAWLTQASTSLVPAFTALAIGFQASFSEEAMFRLFVINLLKKYGVPIGLALFLSAAMWGFGHTGYAIFPMWFRGVEVTTVGIIMGIFYLRYGLLCVIVAHFFIDSFLSSLPYLLNLRHPGFDFYTSLVVITAPLLFGFIAWIFDSKAQERPLSIRFNAQQQFNYNLLRELCAAKTPDQLALFKKDLERYGWDVAIIQRVFDEKQ